MVRAAAFVGILILMFWYLRSHRQMRVAVAFAVAPLTVPVGWVLLTRDFSAIVTALFAYPLALVAGIPLYFGLRRLGWLSLWHIVFGSAILGVFIGGVIVRPSSFNQGTVAVAIMCSVVGAAVGLVFWLIAFPGAKSKPTHGGATMAVVLFLVAACLIPSLWRTEAHAADLSRLGPYGRISSFCGPGIIPRDEATFPFTGCFFLSSGHVATRILATHRITVSVDTAGHEVFAADGVTVMEDRGTASGTNLAFVGISGEAGYRFCAGPTDRNIRCPARVTVFSRSADKSILFMVSECLPPQYDVCVSTQNNWDHEKSRQH